MSCISGYAAIAHSRPKLGELTKNTMKFAKEKLNLSLKSFEKDMIEAEARDMFTFTYLGPGKFKYHGMDKRFPYNCVLNLINSDHYFFSETSYDSRVE